jgi:DNA-binding response OmpR family regulator
MQAKKNKILVIDDSLMARKLVVSYLASDRFEVYEGKDGATGLAVASEVNPDLILLDFVMPGMNGHEVYQALRSQERFANIPVILFSSSYDEVVKKFGHPFVGFEFLHKQATGEQILERVNALLPDFLPDLQGAALEVSRSRQIIQEVPAIRRFRELEQPQALAAKSAAGPTSSNAISEALAALSPSESRVESNRSQPATAMATSLQSTSADFNDPQYPELSVSQQLNALAQRLEALEGQKSITPEKTLEMLIQRLELLERQLNKHTPKGSSSMWIWLLAAVMIATVVSVFVGMLLRPSQQLQPTRPTVTQLYSSSQ